MREFPKKANSSNQNISPGKPVHLRSAHVSSILAFHIMVCEKKRISGLSDGYQTFTKITWCVNIKVIKANFQKFFHLGTQQNSLPRWLKNDFSIHHGGIWTRFLGGNTTNQRYQFGHLQLLDSTNIARSGQPREFCPQKACFRKMS